MISLKFIEINHVNEKTYGYFDALTEYRVEKCLCLNTYAHTARVHTHMHIENIIKKTGTNCRRRIGWNQLEIKLGNRLKAAHTASDWFSVQIFRLVSCTAMSMTTITTWWRCDGNECIDGIKQNANCRREAYSSLLLLFLSLSSERFYIPKKKTRQRC